MIKTYSLYSSDFYQLESRFLFPHTVQEFKNLNSFLKEKLKWSNYESRIWKKTFFNIFESQKQLFPKSEIADSALALEILNSYKQPDILSNWNKNVKTFLTGLDLLRKKLKSYLRNAANFLWQGNFKHKIILINILAW